MAVCLDTVTSIRLTAVTFKYKLLTFSKEKMIITTIKIKGRVICNRFSNGEIKFTPHGKRIKNKTLRSEKEKAFKHIFIYLQKTKNGYKL